MPVSTQPVSTRRTPGREPPAPPDPYDEIDAPQWANLADAVPKTMSPGTSAWFFENARDSVPTPPGATQPPPPQGTPPPPTPPSVARAKPPQATPPAAKAMATLPAAKPAAAPAAAKPAAVPAAAKPAVAAPAAKPSALATQPSAADPAVKTAAAPVAAKKPSAAPAAAKPAVAAPAAATPSGTASGTAAPSVATPTASAAEEEEEMLVTELTPSTISAPLPTDGPASAASVHNPELKPTPSSLSGARRVPAAVSRATKASQAWAASAAKPASASTAPVPAPAPPAAPTRPAAPALSTSNRVRGIDDPKPTTEELQMLEAARRMRENKLQRDKWRTQLETVLGSGATSKLPARSTQPLTIPKEFNLHSGGSRSVPTSPRSDGGGKGTPGGAVGTSSASSLVVKTFGESVKDFTKTPKRFRGKAPHEPPSPATSATKGPPSLTKTESFHLASDTRVGMRPTVKSTAERELEYVQSHASAFKARPVSRRVLDSAGDLGVPRVAKREPTEPKEFALTTARLAERKQLESASSSAIKAKRRAGAGGGAATDDEDASSDAGSTASAPGRFVFKARPFNKALMEGKLAGLAQVSPREPTRPRSPKLSTSARATLHAPKAEAEAAAATQQSAPFAAFKARPMPNHALGPSPLPTPEKMRPLTSPQPFELQSVARHEIYEESRQRSLAQVKADAARARQFKANPMPVTDVVWRPRTESKHTEPKEFALTTSARSGLAQEKLEHVRQERQLAAKRATEFKAREPKVLVAPAFAPRKSTKPLTEIMEANVPFAKTAEREAKRRELEAANLLRRQAMEAAAAEKAKELAAKEAKELAELRKSLQFKAKPANVLHRPAFVVAKGASKRPLTTPKEFKLSSSVRGPIRAA